MGTRGARPRGICRHATLSTLRSVGTSITIALFAGCGGGGGTTGGESSGGGNGIAGISTDTRPYVKTVDTQHYAASRFLEQHAQASGPHRSPSQMSSR